MNQRRPFRFGVTMSSATSRREWMEKARRVEALGYATLTVPDHFPDRLATVPALMAAADATAEITKDRWGAAQRHADQLPGLTVEDVLESPHVLIGTVEQIVEDLHRRRDEYGLSYIVLNSAVEHHVEDFAPVVARLASQ